MEKRISHEDKLEFCKKFNDEKFKKNFKRIPIIPWLIGGLASLLLGGFCVLCGVFLNPFMYIFTASFIVPLFLSYAYVDMNKQVEIESLVKNISYKDFKKMQKSGELTLLNYELSAKEMKINHYAENSELIVEKKAVNKPKSFNVCRINKNNQTETKNNLVKKTKKRHQNQKVENEPRSLECCTIKQETKITYLQLSEFARTIDACLIEFSPMYNNETETIYYVKLKMKNKFVEFEVSPSHFNGLYRNEDLDLTCEWQKYLSNENSNEISV